MKIVVPICKEKGQLYISEFLRQCSHFLVFDSKSNKIQIVKNPFLNELGSDGIQTAIFLINFGADVIIAKQIGDNPLRFFTSAKIKVYNYKGKKAKEAINLFKQNNFSKLTYLTI